jgi:hypothetical protein
MAIIPVACPIRITKTMKCNERSFFKIKTNIRSTFKVSKYTLNNNEMSVSRMLHELTNVVDSIGDIGVC